MLTDVFDIIKMLILPCLVYNLKDHFLPSLSDQLIFHLFGVCESATSQSGWC